MPASPVDTASRSEIFVASGPKIFETGDGDDAEPTSIVPTFRGEKCGGESKWKVPVDEGNVAGAELLS